MLRSYASQLHFQEGWSSLQRLFRRTRNTSGGLILRAGGLGNLSVRITPKMCSKNIQINPGCGRWASFRFSLLLLLAHALFQHFTVQVALRTAHGAIRPSSAPLDQLA